MHMHMHMHMGTLFAGTLLALSGCTQAGSTTLDGGVGIYLDSGSTQCQDDGMNLEEMQQLLVDADIPFSAATCGTDGNMYTAMCGSPDGRIGIFQIAPEHLQQSRALDFEALANVPDASPVDCSRW